jgi:hypothetical protein
MATDEVIVDGDVGVGGTGWLTSPIVAEIVEDDAPKLGIDALVST